MKEVTFLKGKISSLGQKVVDLSDEVSAQRKLARKKEFRVKHLERALFEKDTEGQLHKLDGSVDVARKMKIEIKKLSNKIYNLQKDKNTLRQQNAKLQSEVDETKERELSEEKESAKINALLRGIRRQIQANAAKPRTEPEFNNIKGLLRGIARQVQTNAAKPSKGLRALRKQQEQQARVIKSLEGKIDRLLLDEKVKDAQDKAQAQKKAKKEILKKIPGPSKEIVKHLVGKKKNVGKRLARTILGKKFAKTKRGKKLAQKLAKTINGAIRLGMCVDKLTLLTRTPSLPTCHIRGAILTLNPHPKSATIQTRVMRPPQATAMKPLQAGVRVMRPLRARVMGPLRAKVMGLLHLGVRVMRPLRARVMGLLQATAMGLL